MKLTGKNLIGNKESGEGKNTFVAKNPKSQSDLEIRFCEATDHEMNKAVVQAQSAFGAFKAKTNEEKALFLEAIADNILELGDALIERCTLETALPEARLNGERMRTVNQLKLFASVVREGSWVDARIDTALPNRQPVPKPDIRQMQVPLGPLGIFGASNFPLAFSVAGGDTASALAAGCPVIVKAHQLHPGTSEYVARAILKAAKTTGMPEGFFSLVHGVSNNVGMAIVNHPGIKGIGFTGSFKGGKALFDAANQRKTPIPVFAEMGSINPVFILPGAMKNNRETIASGLISSVNLGVGQFCTNPGLVVTQHSDGSEEFLNKLASVGTNDGPGTMLSDQIKTNYTKKVNQFKTIKGVKLLGESSGKENGNEARTEIFTTDYKTFIKNSVLTEEVFGPSTLNITANKKEELMEIAEKLEGHLTASIFGTEKDLIEYSGLVEILAQKVGRLIFNGFPTGVEVCHSMVHGGPYPATTAPQSTSVGTAAINRFVRPVCFQDFPQANLPDELKDTNPLKIWRLLNGNRSKDSI